MGSASTVVRLLTDGRTLERPKALRGAELLVVVDEPAHAALEAAG